MSAEHVQTMNDLLAPAQELRAVCAALPQPRTMAYRLSDGPNGRTVHWAMAFTETVQFSLDDIPDADVTFVGDWKKMVVTARANRDGLTVDPGLTIEGDPAVLAEIGPVLELARSIATVPVEFPEV